MTHIFRFILFVAVLAGVMAAEARTAPPRAPTPPMGWNSWDAYGFTITEEQFKANARLLAGMKRFGWNTAVIDEGWYMANPLGADLAARNYRYDPNGRLVPDVARFPSAKDGAGLKGIGDWTHRLGLKFGVHIVRGIPKAAVAADLPIAGSSFHASEAADKSALCPWDDANYGVADNAAGQAWYDSLMRQYAAWGVDFIKVDCISDHPYRPTEIRQIAQAIRAAGRPMILSLSPGPTNISHATEVASYAQMWRIMDDMWDAWTFPHNDLNSEFPNGIRNAFDRLAQWSPYVRPGGWPDADMLPFGALYPHPGWGDPRQSRLSEAETRTAFTLWAIARSPLILGGNLTEQPPYLSSVLTNKEVIALDQEDRQAKPLGDVPAVSPDARIWTSSPRGRSPDTVAFFNVGEAPVKVDLPWTSLGFAPGSLPARNLWTGALVTPSNRASFEIAPHDVIVLRVAPRS